MLFRSFGFSSAVQAAQSAIRTAKTEASCNLPNGIGIVKLMGRSAGFVAVHAAMSSGDVDLCLVPEIPIVLEGEKVRTTAARSYHHPKLTLHFAPRHRAVCRF